MLVNLHLEFVLMIIKSTIKMKYQASFNYLFRLKFVRWI